ncbi:hypothetical protein HDU98_002935, partial [Podochytrium sp. JEL0797]
MYLQRQRQLQQQQQQQQHPLLQQHPQHSTQYLLQQARLQQQYAASSSQRPVVYMPPSKPLLMTSQAVSKQKNRRKRNRGSDSEEEEEETFDSEEDDDDDDSEGGGGGGGGGYRDHDDDARQAAVEQQMFEFFGGVDKKEMLDTLMCTEEQADTIIELRPYESVSDMYVKFEIHKRGKKKISKLLEKYTTLMDGYDQVDRLITQCEKKGGEVLGVMQNWVETGAATSPVKLTFTDVPPHPMAAGAVASDVAVASEVADSAVVAADAVGAAEAAGVKSEAGEPVKVEKEEKAEMDVAVETKEEKAEMDVAVETKEEKTEMDVVVDAAVKAEVNPVVPVTTTPTIVTTTLAAVPAPEMVASAPNAKAEVKSDLTTAKKPRAEAADGEDFDMNSEASEESEDSESDAGLHLTGVPRGGSKDELEEEETGSATKDRAATPVRFDPEMCLKKQPANLNKKMQLKGYQLVGVSWLNLLYSKGLGGILADEMGLGKTAQVIAFISLLKQQGDRGSPHLIIVPSSTLENWLREFQNWAPDLTVLSYYGSQLERENIRYNLAEGDLGDYDAVVTTYNLASSSKEDRNFLKKLRPRSMMLDEGHMVKNMQSSRYQNLNSIRTPFRLLLTGTPLQNNLMELLSLLTFIMPKLFANDEEALKQIFTLKATATSDATVLSRQRIHRAKQMMTPFVLRRKKKDVLTELPQKTREEVFCKMTESQDALYQSIIADCKKNLLERSQAAEAAAAPPPPPPAVVEEPPEEEESVAEKPAAKRGRKAAPKKKAAPKAPPKPPAAPKPVTGDNVNVLMQLRKAANHPLLFRRMYTSDKIKVMAREIMKEDQYMDANMEYIREDMEYMSDFELHRLCLNFPTIQHHALCDDEWMDSGKIQWLKEKLPEMIKRGDRVLIFSQFVIMLNVLEAVMQTLEIKFLRLDGSTNVVERQSLIDQYNEDDSIGVFLLSTKAGGLG